MSNNICLAREALADILIDLSQTSPPVAEMIVHPPPSTPPKVFNTSLFTITFAAFMKSSVYIATTLDGFIATSDGSISFLEEFQNTSPQDGDLGFASFLSTVDLVIMGRKTWDQVVSFGEDAWPYGPR